MSRSKHWCFTLNNYTERTEESILELRSIVAYLIYGREVGESGTPHLQGFVSFPSRKSLRQVTGYLPGAHCSIARCILASINYCKKGGDILEIGQPPSASSVAAVAREGQGRRNDLEDLKDAVKGGMTSWDDLMEHHSSVCARYPRFVERYIRAHAEQPGVVAHPLRPWQQRLNERLNREPDDRTIVFLVDFRGNSGKSWFMSYYQQLHPDKCQVLLPGKKQDMAYALKINLRVLFVDAPRSKQGDFIQYDFLEDCKNGRVFSNKYDSVMKTFKPPHVVVAMNEYPKMDMLSEDRYLIEEIGNEPANNDA